LRFARLNGWYEHDATLRFEATVLARFIDLTPDSFPTEWALIDRAWAGAVEGRYTMFYRYDVGARVSIETSNSRALLSGQLIGRALHSDLVAAWYVGLHF
jgi:hypothetical protein